MGLLKVIFFLFIISFPIAEVGRVQFSNGVAISLNDVLLSVLITVWLIFRLYKKKKINKDLLLKPITAFSLIALFSLILNVANLSLDRFFISFLYLLRWASYALLYFIFKDFDARFKAKTSYLLLFSGFLVVLLGYVQYFFYPSLRNLYYLGWDEHLYRLFSSFLDPNFAGAFFALFFLYTINFLRQFKEKMNFRFLSAGIISILTLGALYLTYSRSALIMLIVGITAYLYLINKKRFIIVMAVGALLLVLLLPKAFQTEGTNFLRAASSEARIKSAQESLGIFQKNPVFGVGFNAYRYARNEQGMNNNIWQITHAGAGTDNSFLFVMATTGVIGLVSYIYLLYRIYSLGSLNLKRNKYAVVLVSSLLGLIVNSFFLNSLFYVFILEWIWILAALTESN
jgi:O-antigen ligase